MTGRNSRNPVTTTLGRPDKSAQRLFDEAAAPKMPRIQPDNELADILSSLKLNALNAMSAAVDDDADKVCRLCDAVIEVCMGKAGDAPRSGPQNRAPEIL